MNYLSGALRFVAGTETEPHNVVPRLIDRIKTSALPHDRRSAIIQLTDAAKESPQRQANVAEQALKIIYAILEQDSDYDETVKATIELLIALCGTLEYPSTLSDDRKSSISREQFERETKEATATNIDMYLGLPNSLPLLLQMLDRDDFYIKFGTIELLAAMAANSRQTLQAAVLEAPQGVARICDVLEDPHRHIRSNAVLLISTLCEQSPEICKIVVFGAVLEKLFALIESVSSTHPKTAQKGNGETSDDTVDDVSDDDDTVESAIIIQDSLVAIRTLIYGTPSTSTFFRDSGCVPRLVSVLQQSVTDAALSPSDPSISPVPSETGVRSAIERQSRKNLVIAMQCISGLVHGSDDSAHLVKNDLANSEMLRVLSSIAFCVSSELLADVTKPTNKLLQIRITALKTLSELLRGHDSFRSNFSLAQSIPGRSSVINAQITTLRLMLSDPSAAVRIAAYMLLRDSFVVDTQLNLPSSALRNAMTNSTGIASYSLSDSRNLSHGSLPSSTDISTVTDSVSYIVDALKEALVGWPLNADSAGVFYSASFTSWILANAANAKEQLLNTYANGSPLLPQLIRFLGKMEREKGPSEVRIALFCLVCVWLYDCPAAVSSFLSSAMHLPMLVDILKTDSTHGDVTDVHVRGLAAVLLGICFKATDSSAVSTESSGFLSGGGSGPVVIPSGVVADVIRSRIGVTLFTSCLDDLRATRAYSNRNPLSKTIDELTGREEREGFLSSGGLLGHHNWYEPLIIEVVDDVYKHIGAKAIDLVAGPTIVELPNSSANGYVSRSTPGLSAESKVFTDSTRDEILQSHKEYIRSQDERLDAARGQIEELAAALREAQVQLDANAQFASTVTSSDAYLQLRAERDELNQEKAALEALLSEKTSDYDEALCTLAAYEEEQSSHDDGSVNGSSALQAEVHKLRSQNAAMAKALDSEMQRSMESSRQVADLEDTLHRKDVEINSLMKESESVKRDIQPDVAELLQWRPRAEIAEETLQQEEEAAKLHKETEIELQSRLHASERSRDSLLANLETAKRMADDQKAEYEKLRLTRQHELNASRDSTAANLAAHDEIDFLKAQLQEALQKILEQEKQLSSQPPNNDANMERLQTEFDAVFKFSESGKVELADCKQALEQWQKRAEMSEDIRDKQEVEINRLTTSCHEQEEKLRDLTVALKKQEQLATASKIRVSELEQQCAELDEVRRRTEESLQDVRKEVKVRTEQSIRLAGQVYEIEEQKANLEDQLQAFSDSTTTHKHERLIETPESSTNGLAADQEIMVLKKELEVTRAALSNSRKKMDSNPGQVDKNVGAISRAQTAESELASSRSELQKLEEEMNEMKERILSLDEAEYAKRALTMQVVELQKRVDEQAETKHDVASQPEHSSASLSEVTDLKRTLEEKSTEASTASLALKTCREELSESMRAVADLQKQVSESDAIMSVLLAEKDRASQEAAELKARVDHLSTIAAEQAALPEVQLRLEESEQSRLALSQKLNSAIDEREENITVLQSVIDARVGEIQSLADDLKVMTDKHDDLARRIEVAEKLADDRQMIIDEKSQELDEQERSLIHAKDTLANLENSLREKSTEANTASLALKTCREELSESMRAIADLQKQVSTLATLRTEKEWASQEAAELKARVDHLSTIAAEQAALPEVQLRLEESEQSRLALSQKLNSAIDEREENITVLQSVIDARVGEIQSLADDLKVMTDKHDDLARRIEVAENLADDRTLELQTKQGEIERLRNELIGNTGQLDSKTTQIESLEKRVSQAERRSEESATKLTSVTVAHELSEIEGKVLQAEVDALRAQCAQLTKSLSSTHDSAELKAHEWRVVTETQVQALREFQSKVDSSDMKCLSLEKKVGELTSKLQKSEQEAKKLIHGQQLISRISAVENVVESIICNASCSATVKSLSLQLDETQRQLDITRLSLGHHERRSAQLAQQLSDIQSIKTQGDESKRFSDISNGAASMHQTIDHHERRIKELEDALRDAARTVVATNKELITAQALLVEISSDKTVMRAELSRAEQQIEQLENQVCSTCVSAATPADRQTDMSDFSDLSEPEANTLDTGLDDDDEFGRGIVEIDLKTAQVQVLNLKTALSRSVSEADSASSHVTDIVEKIGTLEAMMQSSRENELVLNQKLSDIHQSSETERRQLLQEISTGKQANEYLTQQHTEALEVAGVQNTTIADLEEKVADLKQERQRLSSRVDDLLTQLDISKEEAEEAENVSKLLRSERDELQNHFVELESKMSACEQDRAELKMRLSQTEHQMVEDQQKYELEIFEKVQQWDSNAKGYELEIERVSSELEKAERGKRSIELELKSEQSKRVNERTDLQEKIDISNASVKSWTDRANELTAHVEILNAKMDQMSKLHRAEMRDATRIQHSLKEELKAVEAVRGNLQSALNSSESDVLKLKMELTNENEKKQVLEEENQDFVKSTAWLEQRCKGLDEEIKRIKQLNDELSRVKGNLELKLEEEAHIVRKLRKDIEDKQTELDEETASRKQVKEDASILEMKLERKSGECETLTRDNGDLRAWVNDLEKQASELQNAASDFEEVEQSLQESLEAQRAAAEQISKLNEDLRKEREALRLAEMRGRKAERERESANESLSACEEKLRGVEARLSEIRQSSVVKLSAAEASVRSQAQRCAELETVLAQAQRQVAELGHASDEAFAVKSDLRRTREEVGRVKQRCEEAESKAESLEEKLNKCHDEMERLRECAGAEGLKSLEAEHNELLVYLADLELELTTLKEQAGTDLES